MKVLFELIQAELRSKAVYFQLSAVKFDDGYLAVKFAFCDADAVEKITRDILENHSKNVRFEITSTPGTVTLRVDPEEPVIMGIPFSSPDEERGTEPIEIAQLFVRREIEKNAVDFRYTTYVVWFAYVLGGWKALVSTTIADGRYYEVTYNKEADEFYVDTYLKIQNTKYNSTD